MSRKWMWSLMGVMIILAILLSGVVGINCHYQVKEAKTFRVAPWTPRTCPFPFYLDVRFSKKKDKEAVWKAAMELHREIGGPLKYGPLFLPIENLSVPPNKHIIPVRDALPQEERKGEVCGPVIPQIEAQFGGIVMGALHYHVMRDTDTFAGGYIVICQKRIRVIRDLKGPLAEGLPKRPMSFYVKHELMHLLIGGGHPQWGCGLTCASPTHRTVNKHELAIVKRTYDPLCLPSKKSISKE